MSLTLKLLRSCSIRNGAISVDGANVFTGAAEDFGTFATAAFRALGLDYPKFHKMDNLAKLGFLAAEHLLAGRDFRAPGVADRTGIILANATSSLDTDLRYAAQVRQGLPSPALFVYTLPNIVVGELCIRHGITGENMLFVAEQYDAAAQVDYVTNLFADNRIDKCLGGWIDLFDQEYRAFFYLVSTSPDLVLPDYNATNVQTLFTS